MMRNNELFRKFCFTLIALVCGALTVCAGEVSQDQAAMAVRNWVNEKVRLGKRLDATVSKVRSYITRAGGKFHAVGLSNGGVVFTSADTELEPIIAFSGEGSVELDVGSPLYDLLRQDLENRSKAVAVKISASANNANSTITNAMPGFISPRKNMAKWLKLLAPERITASQIPVESIDDIDDLRVPALVKTRWDQSEAYTQKAENSAVPCYNRYVPDVKIYRYYPTPYTLHDTLSEKPPCGCPATAMAQILKFWEYPSGERASFGNTCSVYDISLYYDGQTGDLYDEKESDTPRLLELVTTAGEYKWKDMIDNPLSYWDGQWHGIAVTDANCAAIGKLTYDCGVAVEGYYYGLVGSGIFSNDSSNIPKALRSRFGVKNACITCNAEALSAVSISKERRNAICANIDAGCPVILLITGDGGHAVVADGYGFTGGQDDAYVHLNMGWSGANDVWYNLPYIQTGENPENFTGFDVIRAVVYNIFPEKSGEIVSGQLTDFSGKPVANATVKICESGSTTTLKTSQSSQYGVYSFIVEGGKAYKVTATTDRMVGECLTSKVPTSSQSSVGNSWGNDIVMANDDVQSVSPSQLSASASTDGSKVILTWNYPEAGASFYIYRSTTGTKPHDYTYTKTSTASGLITFDDSSVTSGTTYYYWVSAKQSGENYTESEAAGPVSATPKKTLESILIVGKDASGNVLTSVDSRGKVYYTCTATYSDKSTAVVNPAWNVDPSVCGNFFSGNTFTANPLAAEQTATILAAYSEGGEANLKKATCKLTVLASAVASRPANDNFDNAIQLNGTSGKTSGTTAGATVESDEFLAYNTSANTVWWTWTAPADGNLTLTTDGSGIATAIDVYSGDSLGSVALFNRLGYDFTPSSILGASVKSAVTKGTRYNIRVAGFNNAEGAVSLSWSLSALEKIAAPKNFSATYDSVNNRVNLSWEKGASYCHYVLYRAAELTQPGKPKRSYVKPGYNTFSYADSSVIAGSKYWYWVVATKDDYADSDPVGPVSVTISGTSRPDLCFASVPPQGWPQTVFLSNADSNTNCVRRFGVGETIYLFNEFHNGGSSSTPKGVDILHEVLDENGNVIASNLYTYDGVLKAEKSLWWPGSVHPVLQGLNPGNYTYRCTLDDDHAICETSEGNNVATYDFVVTTMTAMQFYVDASRGSDANDGSSVGKAFASIQKAVDGASDGDTIWVNDGTYASFVTDNKRIVIRSVNGAADTIIDASLESSGKSDGRCAILGWESGETNTVLSGFSLIKGVGYNGGGVYGGTLIDCALVGNQSPGDDNDKGAGSGGAACCSVLHRCLVAWNSARKGGAGRQCVMNNCLVGENEASQYGGAVCDSTMNNCTVVGNHSDDYAGGCYLGEVNNCIVWDNLAESDSNAVWGTVCRYSCINDRYVGGVGVIHDNPIFMRWAGIAEGDYSLQPNSPCVNAGCDAYVVGDKDLNDDARVCGLQVDMGAFEWQGDYPDINLVFAAREDDGWTSPVFLTMTKGSSVPMTEFTEGEKIYLYYGIRNAASLVDIHDFKIRFTLNSTLTFDDDWFGYGVRGGSVGLSGDYDPSQLQNLAPGSYALKCKIIAAEGVVETDLTDNEIAINFVVKSQSSALDFEYSAVGGKAVITKYVGKGGNVNIPQSIDGYSVVEIGHGAFNECGSLVSVAVPSSVTNIGGYAFAWCGGLQAVDIPSSVTVIGDNAFAGCENLMDVAIPPNVSSIEACTFVQCRSLPSVEIPLGVTNIGPYAFAECASLTKVTIPAQVESVGEGAFKSCSSLTEIAVENGNAHYVSAQGVLYTKDMRTLLCCPGGASETFEIPSSVQTVASCAFAGCCELTSILMSPNVTKIGIGAFSDCSGLSTIDIPDGVTSVETEAFARCSGLTSVRIPSTVTDIDYYAFGWCSGLESVAIPSSVKSIQFGAFEECYALDTVYVDVGDETRVRELLEESGLDCSGIAFVSQQVASEPIPVDYVSVTSDDPWGNGYVLAGGCALYTMTYENPSNGGAVRTLTVSNRLDSALDPDGFGPSDIRIDGTTYDFGAALDAGFFQLPSGAKVRVSYSQEGPVAVWKFAAADNGVLLSSGETMEIDCLANVKSNVTPGTEIYADVYFGVNDSVVVYPDMTYVNVVAGQAAAPCNVSATARLNEWEDGYEVDLSWDNVLDEDTTYEIFRSVGEPFDLTEPYDCAEGGSYTDFDAFYGGRTYYYAVAAHPEGDYVVGELGYCNVTIPILLNPDETTCELDADGSCGDWYVPVAANRLWTATTDDGWIHVTTEFSSDESAIDDGLTFTVDENDKGARTGWIVLAAGNVAKTIKVEQSARTFDVIFDAGDHGVIASGETYQTVAYGEAAVAPTVTADAGWQFAGWDKTFDCVTSELTIYALYEQVIVEDKVATPVITPADGATFSGESCEVTITCATAGASIYYTTNGVTPKTTSMYLYTGPFSVTDTVSIKAVATKEGLTKSDYATATISKLAMTLERAIGATSEMIVTTGGDAEWEPVSDTTVQTGALSARSGLVNDDDECESWLQVAVSGSGKLTFYAKTSCEHDDDGTCTWDRLMVYADGAEKLDMRMDGESGWKQKEIAFDTVGPHTVRWVYHKDESDYDGEDCAWVYGVVWTPSDADPIPELPPSPTSADVEAALAGSVDAHLQECITEPSVYNDYRAWAETVKAPGGSTAAGAQAVKDSPNAWLSFALDSATLIQNPPADGDVKVEKFEQTATAGAFDFTVGVENIPVGDGAKPGNLAKVFGIEGGSTLSPNDMSADKVDITFGTPENGKVKFTAGPKDKTQSAFFMKVKMTP